MLLDPSIYIPQALPLWTVVFVIELQVVPTPLNLMADLHESA